MFFLSIYYFRYVHTNNLNLIIHINYLVMMHDRLEKLIYGMILRRKNVVYVFLDCYTTFLLPANLTVTPALLTFLALRTRHEINRLYFQKCVFYRTYSTLNCLIFFVITLFTSVWFWLYWYEGKVRNVNIASFSISSE